nr:hypothetical protein [Tanacetum cinerariifolium]
MIDDFAIFDREIEDAFPVIQVVESLSLVVESCTSHDGSSGPQAANCFGNLAASPSSLTFRNHENLGWRPDGDDTMKQLPVSGSGWRASNHGLVDVEDSMEADASREARQKSMQVPQKLRGSIISNRSTIEDSKSVGRPAHGLNRLRKKESKLMHEYI